MRAITIAALSVVTGCAQILGLEDTTLDGGAIDAPDICDGAPACNFSGGRSICGQLYATGMPVRTPIRAASPTGAFCTASAATGPCSFTVAAMSTTDYFGGSTTSVAGQMDDCGRFVVPDLASTIPDAAVFFSAQSGFKNNATLVLARDPVAGADKNVEAYAVSDATVMAWGSQLSGTTTVTATRGYLVRYTRNGNPLADEQVAKDLGNPITNPPGTVPYGAYFTDPGFGTLDKSLMSTSSHGTALLELGSGTFSLEGYRMGRRCRVENLQHLDNTFIFVLPTDC